MKVKILKLDVNKYKHFSEPWQVMIDLSYFKEGDTIDVSQLVTIHGTSLGYYDKYLGQLVKDNFVERTL